MSKHSHKSPTEAELTEQFRGSVKRITGQRKAILEVLRQHPHPMTNRQIHAALPGRKCDLTTIYRSIKLLVEAGLVERFDFGDGVARFELAGHHSTDHHHHLICSECERVVEIEECFVADLQKRLAKQHGFTGISHRLEFFGTCPDCAGTTKKKGKHSRLSCGC